MADNSFDAAEHFSDDLSQVYDERIREIIPGYETMHEVAQYLLQAHISENGTILVAGVGTGHEAIAYAASRPGWQIVGFDPSEKMLEKAREKIKSHHLENVTLVLGTINDISPQISFDGAASILVMQFLPDNGEKEHYLQSISLKLKPGAKIVLLDLEGVKYSENYNTLISAWKAHQFATRKNKEQIVRDFNHVDKNLQFVSEERIRELLTGAGFTDICKFYKSLLFGGYLATKKEE